jgi:hypothetical protein
MYSPTLLSRLHTSINTVDSLLHCHSAWFSGYLRVGNFLPSKLKSELSLALLSAIKMFGKKVSFWCICTAVADNWFHWNHRGEGDVQWSRGRPRWLERPSTAT